MLSIISAIVILGILIFVHELGHFIFAKLFKVGVEKFSLGFGPKIIGKKIGETEYLLSAFPLGGYVKMVGEAVEDELSEEDKLRSFNSKSPLQRIIIVAAGPIFNLVFACLVFIIVFLLGVPTGTTKIGSVLKDKPAARAGLRANDVVMAVNGKAVSQWKSLVKVIMESGGKSLKIMVKRDNLSVTVDVLPESRTQKNMFGETVTSPVIGIVPSEEFVIEHFSLPEAFVKGSVQTWDMVKLTVLSLAKIASRDVPLDTIGGPIMIAKLAGQQATAGLASFLAFMALLSVNLGILNLLPIPILDGGHLVFYVWELVFRKPVSMKSREVAQQVGLVLLVGLMVLAFYNDIARYFLGRV
jgi:regulator of sigma E protease